MGSTNRLPQKMTGITHAVFSHHAPKSWLSRTVEQVVATVSAIVNYAMWPFKRLINYLVSSVPPTLKTVPQQESASIDSQPSSRKSDGAKVIPLTLDFTQLNDQEQAREILDMAHKLLGEQPQLPGVAITYSANHVQTREILKTYRNGEYYTGVAGANQANVMHEMEVLLKTNPRYRNLQGRVRIAPISTMKYGKSGILPVTDREFAMSTDNITSLMNQGWCIIGWCNQFTENKDAPFAIGGGVSNGVTPQKHLDQIQQLLKDNTLPSTE